MVFLICVEACALIVYIVRSLYCLIIDFSEGLEIKRAHRAYKMSYAFREIGTIVAFVAWLSAQVWKIVSAIRTLL